VARRGQGLNRGLARVQEIQNFLNSFLIFMAVLKSPLKFKFFLIFTTILKTTAKIQYFEIFFVTVPKSPLNILNTATKLLIFSDLKTAVKN